MPDNILQSPVICFNGEFEKPQLIKLANGQAAIFSARAPAKKTANEDAFAIIPVKDKAIVLVVADGLGGLPAGEAASRMAIDELIRSLKRASRDEIHIRGAILDGIEQANKKILALKSGAATTLVIVEIQDRKFRTYHAGDSMIMLVGNRGKLKYSVIPHSPTGYALESGIIDESEAMQDEERHLISNCIGSADMRVEIGPSIDISVRDTLIMASDGLADNLYDNEIVEFCRKGQLLLCANQLVKVSRENMEHPKQDRNCHPDDLTFILFRQKLT